MAMPKSEPTAAVTMSDEAETPRLAAIKGTFFQHKRAFLYCGLVCLGGFQLGKCGPHGYVSDRCNVLMLTPRSRSWSNRWISSHARLPHGLWLPFRHFAFRLGN